MKKYALILAGFILAATGLIAADGNQKVPDEFALKIQANLLDQARKQNDSTQMYVYWLQSNQGKQYTADQEAIVHDRQELEGLKKQALEAAKLDVNINDVDVEKLEFFAKPSVKK